MTELALWPTQQKAVELIAERLRGERKKFCLASPTGGGKTRIMTKASIDAVGNNCRVALIMNRKELIRNTIATLRNFGVRCGTMAADFDKRKDSGGVAYEDIGAPVQVCMMQTLAAGIRSGSRHYPAADLVMIDEAHLLKGDQGTKLIQHYETASLVTGVTATPVNMKWLYDELHQFGTNSELRRLGALMPAHIFAPWQFDLKHIGREASGEYSIGKFVKTIWSQRVFGPLFEHLQIHNPDRRPFLSFAPDVASSVWLAQEYTKNGLPTAHIDGEDVWVDGEFHESRADVREQVLSDIRTGKIVGITNRFVMREGVDIPELYILQLACPIGNTHTFVQICGRVLRFHESLRSLGHVKILDHGGNCDRHGSPNQDWPWHKYFDLPERICADERERQFKERKEREPITCPRCGGMRLAGPVCPHCSYRHEKSVRHILQADGRLKPLLGDIIKPINRVKRDDTEKKWSALVHACRNKKDSKMTFAQLEGLFVQSYGYYPPRDIAFMPKDSLDFYRLVRNVDRGDLIDPRITFREDDIL